MPKQSPGFLDLTPGNLAQQHLCCALAGGQHREGVERKRAFLASGFDSGLVFRKLDVRGKVFVEYAPAESAWRPVVAPGYLVIHCLWVSGRFKGKGLGRELLANCLDTVGERHGVVAVSGRKPYLTDTRFYLRHGFEIVETTETGFDLVSFRSNIEAPAPRFSDNARRATVPQNEGVHLEYADQCPFVPTCVRDMATVVREFDLPVSTRELDSVDKAQAAASPFGTFGAFLHGRFMTHELMSPRKFRKLLESRLR